VEPKFKLGDNVLIKETQLKGKVVSLMTYGNIISYMVNIDYSDDTFEFLETDLEPIN
jgi:hypothetical protein